MSKLFVGVFKSRTGGLGFDVSEYKNRDEAKTYLTESYVEVVDFLEIEIGANDSECSVAVIRALASTSEGVNVLSVLLRAAAESAIKHSKV